MTGPNPTAPIRSIQKEIYQAGQEKRSGEESRAQPFGGFAQDKNKNPPVPSPLFPPPVLPPWPIESRSLPDPPSRQIRRDSSHPRREICPSPPENSFIGRRFFFFLLLLLGSSEVGEPAVLFASPGHAPRSADAAGRRFLSAAVRCQEESLRPR